jgi:hypothetical protein
MVPLAVSRQRHLENIVLVCMRLTKRTREQVRARLKEMDATMISAEHLIRLFILVIGFWLIGVFFVGHRIYTEIVSVRRHSCVLRFSPPPSSTKLARDLQEDIQSAVAGHVQCGDWGAVPADQPVQQGLLVRWL